MLILTAISMVALLGAGAMGVDVGFSVYGSRQAQAMADTAALDLVQNIGTADSLSTNTAIQTYLNGLLAGVQTDNASNSTLSVTPGVWQSGAFSTPSAGCAGTVFQTSPPPCNAVAVTASQTVPQIFWGGFNTLTGHSGASTIAAWTPESGFSIGSYLATVDTQQSAVLNVLLGTLGTSASVTVLGYEGLANTYVSVNQLITASGGLLTTSDAMTTPLPANDWQTFWNDAVANQLAQTNCTSSPLLCNASTALTSGLSFSGGVTTDVKLCQLVSVNGSSCSNGSLSTYGLNANLNALQTLTTEAEVTNGSNALNVQSALSITGVTAATLSLSLIEPPQVAYGPVGSSTTASPCPVTAPATSTCATTAQVSSDLKLTVGGLVLDIPLSAAVGYGTLSQITCSNNVFQNAKINVSTTTATGAVTLAGLNIATLTISGVSNKAGSFSTVPPTSSSVSARHEPEELRLDDPDSLLQRDTGQLLTRQHIAHLDPASRARSRPPGRRRLGGRCTGGRPQRQV